MSSLRADTSLLLAQPGCSPTAGLKGKSGLNAIVTLAQGLAFQAKVWGMDDVLLPDKQLLEGLGNDHLRG